MGIVVTFEALIGVIQPQAGEVLVITTFDGDGAPNDRVVSRLQSAGQLYVAANHWPRAWYSRTLANPKLEVTANGETAEYRAVPITGAERGRIDAEHRLGIVFRALTGFPPPEFVRLEPR